jgi:N utilization substance protein B
MLERSRARMQALQILFQREVTGSSAVRIIEERSFVDDEFGPNEPSEFCRTLALGTEENLAVVDQRLSEVSEHWVVSRMPLVDRNILRLAVFELMFLDEIPPSVTINEAVELAKTYGGEDSSKFVNGVLGKVADQLATDPQAPSAVDMTDGTPLNTETTDG